MTELSSYDYEQKTQTKNIWGCDNGFDYLN